eukprot:TRINITY_DN27356_c0_g1_i1.p1 TRINITY_DN27356_c0_g1~~TRINITY_DN27356_c0_g1_i1.p1  ORF type:complete len:658 (+),score=118.20 TRINITY_DN27356_c0_g1_i1:97-1974(+)
MADFDPTDYDGAAGQEGFDPLLPDPDDAAGDGQDAEAREEAQLRDAVLFCVDCSHRDALKPLRPGSRCLVGEALAAAASFMKTKVVTSPDDRLGVALYGVREKQNPNNFEGISVLQELDRPSAQRIKQLEQEAARSPGAFEERYGCGRAVPVSDMFWTCTTIFNLNANPKQFRPRIFLFTCQDSPEATLDELASARTRVQDLTDMGVDIEFFPLCPTGTPAFAMERFWGSLLPVASEDYVAEAVMQLEDLDRRIRRRIHRKRTLQRLPFYICDGVELSVSVFVTLLEAKVPMPVYLLNENNKPLKSETKQICEQTGALLHPVDDIRTYVDIAGQRIYVTRKEMNETKQFCEPGMRLIGFKPQSCLKPHHRIFHSYFVYPNDRGVTGSATFVSALLAGMIERKLLALASYVARRNAEPALVALIPQAEEEDSDQVKPPGFHMVRLPWGEEIRQCSIPAPEGMPAEMPDELKAAARSVVSALRLDGLPLPENPVLQKHYAAVQALALGEEQPEETVDVLQPHPDLQHHAPKLQALKAAVDAVAPVRAPVKRSLPASSEAAGLEMGSAPKVRREMPPAPATLEAMRELVHSGEVDRLTVSVLRDWLKGQGIANTGKKLDLVERVRACV